MLESCGCDSGDTARHSVGQWTDGPAHTGVCNNRFRSSETWRGRMVSECLSTTTGHARWICFKVMHLLVGGLHCCALFIQLAWTAHQLFLDSQQIFPENLVQACESIWKLPRPTCSQTHTVTHTWHPFKMSASWGQTVAVEGLEKCLCTDRLTERSIMLLVAANNKWRVPFLFWGFFFGFSSLLKVYDNHQCGSPFPKLRETGCAPGQRGISSFCAWITEVCHIRDFFYKPDESHWLTASVSLSRVCL